jgi:hypothetical protein
MARAFSPRGVRLNRGGFPARKKMIFDAAARRRAFKALDVLEHAIDHVCKTATFQDPGVDLWMDKDSEGAVQALTMATRRVHADNERAQAAAKARS